MKGSNALIRAISYACVYIGAVIGAGYASGQEILQFFAGYGYIGIAGAIITTTLLAWYGAVFMELGHRLKTNSHRDVCRYLCGDKIGGFSRLYSPLLHVWHDLYYDLWWRRCSPSVLWLGPDCW